MVTLPVRAAAQACAITKGNWAIPISRLNYHFTRKCYRLPKLVVNFRIAAIVLATHIHFCKYKCFQWALYLLHKDMVIKAIPNDRQIHA